MYICEDFLEEDDCFCAHLELADILAQSAMPFILPSAGMDVNGSIKWGM